MNGWRQGGGGRGGHHQPSQYRRTHIHETTSIHATRPRLGGRRTATKPRTFRTEAKLKLRFCRMQFLWTTLFATTLCSSQSAIRIAKRRRTALNASGPKCSLTMSGQPHERRARARGERRREGGRQRQSDARCSFAFRACIDRAHAARESEGEHRNGAVSSSKALPHTSLPLPLPHLRFRLQQFVIDGGGTDVRVATIRLETANG